ncbi:TPA: hypothetical protein DCF80_01485 [Candidatus Saccharibacteria bacterium]|nr:hypothetical protein [Candidatus Saccharibacteria bacterium]
MNKSLKALVYTAWFWLLLILLFVMNQIDPVSAGPGGILLVFVLVYAIVASLLFTVFHWGVWVVSDIIVRRGRRVTARSYRVGVRKAYYIASALAFGPVLLLALSSVRQLRWTDILLVVIFLALAIFYITKREK